MSRAALLGLTAATGLFWGLRFVYWHATDESLFSDMADFYTIAENVAAGRSFAHDEFWQSYRAPVLPLLGAVKILLFGDSMLAWRLMQASLLFGLLGWLVRELRLLLRMWWPAIALLLVVAVSKSSIFWSFKFAKEGLHEALLYGVLAAALALLRRPSWRAGLWLGALAMTASLNRSNFLVALVLLPPALLWFHDNWRHRLRHLLPSLGAIGLGALLVWAPWGLRTYRLYGHPLLLTTDGAAVALDGMRHIDLTEPDGSTRVIGYDQFVDSARHRFANDAMADAWLGQQVRRWILAHPWRWLLDTAHRAAVSAFLPTIHLTHVPRDRLLPGWLDWLLLDKNVGLCIGGLLGLLAAGWLHRSLWLLGSLTVAPWLAACCLLGLPRLFEPNLPIVLFGNVCLAWFLAETRWLRRRGSLPRLPPGA